jgi:hypothetical protein
MEKKNNNTSADPNFQLGAGLIVIFAMIIVFYGLGVITSKYWH